jgi:hypothetical protein
VAVEPPPGMAGFLDRFGDESAEIAWLAGLAWIDRAAAAAREGKWGRFRYYPAGELRRLRRDLAGALQLCRWAVAMQEEENEHSRELTAELHAAAEEAGRRRRRAQTLPAERARLAKQRARKEKGA